MGRDSTPISIAPEQFSFKLFSIIFSIHLLAILAFFFCSWSNFLAWISCHLLFGTIGASIGLHRYCSHRSFDFKSNTFKTLVAGLATLCFQGGPIFWAAAHREHHRFSEKNGDPHNAKRGFFWSHMGWLFYLNPNGFNYIKSIRVTADLKKDKVFNFFELHSIKINILFLITLFSLSAALGDIGMFFWIGPLRIVTVWHSTWLINSYAHGASVFEKNSSEIKNSLLMAILIGGDGDHLYHHKRPSSIKHSERKFHLDYGYWTLILLKKMNLVDFTDNRIAKTQFPSEKAL